MTYHNHLLVVLDGMDDDPVPSLQDLTPLQSAHTPHLNSLQPLPPRSNTPPGRQADTLACLLTMLGVPAPMIPTGRAFVEAASLDQLAGTLSPKDLVLRANTSGVQNGILVQSGKPLPALPPLHLPQKAALYHLSDYRYALVLPGAAAAAATLQTHPPHQHIGEPMEALWPTGNDLAFTLTALSQELLALTADTALLFWDPSPPVSLPSFAALHNLAGAVVCAIPVVTGIARLMGLSTPCVPGATGDVDTNLPGKVAAAQKAMQTHGFVLLHIGGPDEASHRKNPAEKSAFLTRVDQEVIGPLIEALPAGWRMTVASDHATLSATGAHSPRPVAAYTIEK